jgi:hypothetical protein
MKHHRLFQPGYLQGSLAVKNRVFYLDGKKEPQAQG